MVQAASQILCYQCRGALSLGHLLSSMVAPCVPGIIKHVHLSLCPTFCLHYLLTYHQQRSRHDFVCTVLSASAHPVIDKLLYVARCQSECHHRSIVSHNIDGVIAAAEVCANNIGLPPLWAA